MASNEHKYPSELEGEELVQNRIKLIQQDFDYREKYVDMSKAADLYEMRSDGVEDGIPRVNHINRAVEDHISVALLNTPEARMKPTRDVEMTQNPVERQIRVSARKETTDTVNGLVDTILTRNDYQDEVESCVRQSAIYGVGYLKVDVDRSMDVRNSWELRELLKKPMKDWDEEDAKQYELESKRIDVSHVDSRQVIWERGNTRINENTMRVSIIEYADTETLQAQYGNDKIQPGQFPHFIQEKVRKSRSQGNSRDDIITAGVNSNPNDDGITAKVTTWELEPVYVTKQADIAGSPTKTFFQDYQMVKTVIAGGQLVEKTVTGSHEGPVQLPLVPFYLRESEDHPYGYSIALALEVSQEFINLMRTIIYKSARNAVSPQGVLVAMENLTPDDVERVNRVLTEGGVAGIEGNFDGAMDISETVMPLSYNQSQLSSAAVEAMQREEQAFQAQSDSLDQQAVARAESGQAKQAQILANDRPKTVSLGLLSRAVENVYERIYELVRVNFDDNFEITIDRKGGENKRVKLNNKSIAFIPIIDNEQLLRSPQNATPKNPLGILGKEIEFTLNDMKIPMKAQAEGRGSLPVDPFARFNRLITMWQVGIITTETFRDLSLDPDIKAIDDKNRQEAQRRMPQQLQQELQQGGTEGQVPQNNQGLPTEGLQSSPDQQLQGQNQAQLNEQDRLRNALG